MINSSVEFVVMLALFRKSKENEDERFLKDICTNRPKSSITYVFILHFIFKENVDKVKWIYSTKREKEIAH